MRNLFVAVLVEIIIKQTLLKAVSLSVGCSRE